MARREQLRLPLPTKIPVIMTWQSRKRADHEPQVMIGAFWG
jgi:hypothetical protein